jgi:hypothetical protein
MVEGWILLQAVCQPVRGYKAFKFTGFMGVRDESKQLLGQKSSGNG